MNKIMNEKIFKEMNNMYDQFKHLDIYDKYLMDGEDFKIDTYEECIGIKYERYYKIPWCNVFIKMETENVTGDGFFSTKTRTELKTGKPIYDLRVDEKIDELYVHNIFENYDIDEFEAIVQWVKDDIIHNDEIWFNLSINDIEKLLEKYCVDTIEEVIMRHQYEDSGLL